MKLRVICQICGRTRIIDTDKPAKQDHLGWDNYCLGDFEIEIPGVYDTYEIWICDKCHAKASETPYYNWGELAELIKESLGIWGELAELIKKYRGDEIRNGRIRETGTQ